MRDIYLDTQKKRGTGLVYGLSRLVYGLGGLVYGLRGLVYALRSLVYALRTARFKPVLAKKSVPTAFQCFSSTRFSFSPLIRRYSFSLWRLWL